MEENVKEIFSEPEEAIKEKSIPKSEWDKIISTQKDVMETLQKLEEFLNDGIITEEEFQKKKKNLLDRI